MNIVIPALTAALAWGVADAPPCGAVNLGAPRPELTRVFTPLSAPPGLYDVSTTSRPIAEIAGALKACDPRPAPGAWVLTRPEAHEAFGQAGIYDRFRLAQLFGGHRLTVVRGSLARANGRDAYTLISPYPDAALDRIESGTMVIVIHLAL